MALIKQKAQNVIYVMVPHILIQFLVSLGQTLGLSNVLVNLCSQWKLLKFLYGTAMLKTLQCTNLNSSLDAKNTDTSHPIKQL